MNVWVLCSVGAHMLQMQACYWWWTSPDVTQTHTKPTVHRMLCSCIKRKRCMDHWPRHLLCGSFLSKIKTNDTLRYRLEFWSATHLCALLVGNFGLSCRSFVPSCMKRMSNKFLQNHLLSTIYTMALHYTALTVSGCLSEFPFLVRLIWWCTLHILYFRFWTVTSFYYYCLAI